jgi:hypothetical protein
MLLTSIAVQVSAKVDQDVASRKPRYADARGHLQTILVRQLHQIQARISPEYGRQCCAKAPLAERKPEIAAGV